MLKRVIPRKSAKQIDPLNANLQRSAPDFVVTLIHGTILDRHAGPSSWIEDGSFFCEQLRSELNGTVKFVPFRWSGANSHAERDKAARKLSAELKKNRELKPNSKHFVIGHSHGGNVAVWALQNAEYEMSASGVVCLATPFLRARPRKIEATLRFSSHALWGLCAFGGFFVVWPALFVPSHVIKDIPMPNVPISTAVTVMGIAFFAACQLATWLPYVILRRRALLPMIEGFRSRQADLLSKNAHCGAVDTPLFCAASNIDGPFVWLSGVRAIAAAPFWISDAKHYFVYVVGIGIVSICIAAELIPWFMWLPVLATFTAILGVIYGLGHIVAWICMVVSSSSALTHWDSATKTL